jgi:hypothetical protein
MIEFFSLTVNIHSPMTTLDFIVMQDCAGKFIHPTQLSGNGEWLFSKNICICICVVLNMKTICRDCNSQADSNPTVFVRVENSLGL